MRELFEILHLISSSDSPWDIFNKNISLERGNRVVVGRAQQKIHPTRAGTSLQKLLSMNQSTSSLNCMFYEWILYLINRRFLMKCRHLQEFQKEVKKS